jgi:FAD/FMN-containing dehydrogenase
VPPTSNASPPTPVDLAGLDAALEGEAIGPDDPRYDPWRAVWNAAIDHRPAAIARCASPDDVAKATVWALERGLRLSVRSAGHDVGGRSVVPGGLVLDLRDLAGTEVDPVGRTIAVGGGATWATLNDAAHVHGLATTGAALSGTGVVGVALGGGIGWTSGTQGFCVDNLVGAEVVLASGERVWADADHHSDLHWALRGAGANFGVVTRIELAGHDLVEAYAAALAVDLDDAPRLFDWYLATTPRLPDHAMAYVILAGGPGGRPMAILQLFDGGGGSHGTVGRALADEVRALGVELVVDQAGTMPYPSINRLLDDAYPPGRRAAWRSAYLRGLDRRAVEALLAAYRATPSPGNRVLVQHFHGVACRIGPTDTAFPHRSPGYNLLASADWAHATQDVANRAWAADVLAAMADHLTPGVYLNYVDADEEQRVADALGPNWERALEVKAAYDPTDAFRGAPPLRGGRVS